MGLGNLPGDGQPQPNPLGFAGAERLEQPVGNRRGGARPGVVDGNGHLGGRDARNDAHLPAGGDRFDGIEHEIQQQMTQLFLVGRQADGIFGGVDLQLDTAMPTGRTDQQCQFVDQRVQVAGGTAGGLGAAGGEKALQVLFGQRELPQRDRQTLLVDMPAMSLMKLHGDARPGDVVAQVMCQAAA